MKTPMLFGLPLYVGMKRRVAKKYVRYFWRFAFTSEQGFNRWFKDMADKGVGSLVHGCSSFNEQIKEVQANYYQVGKGKVLCDAQIYSENNGCNAKYCGIGVPYTYKETVANLERLRQRIKDDPQSKEWGWDIRYRPDVFTLHEDGTYSINYEREKELETQG